MKRDHSLTVSNFLFKTRIISVFLGLLFTSVSLFSDQDTAIEKGISEYAEIAPLNISTVPDEKESSTDHSKLKELQGPFSSGPEVTRVCLTCHTETGQQFLKNIHWTWDYKHSQTGQHLGKRVLINNYCTNAKGNEGMCAQCHAGYNLSDAEFDFTNQENVDCLICHESTGTYFKIPTTKANQACSIMFEGKPKIEWAVVAQSVALPSRKNCGTCHFYGGAGDNVKHGDLSSVLFNPSKAIDVHMSASGENFTCITCHVGEGHEWSGSRYQMLVNDTTTTRKPGLQHKSTSCISCHSALPHSIKTINGVKLNGHTDRVACETCHIPEIARGGVATMIDWDWQSMGKLKNGEAYKLKKYTQGDGKHRVTYKSIKGSFAYAEDLQPVYAWFDGTMRYKTIDTKFDPSHGPININSFSGSSDDPNSKIYPFKRMHATQPYDKGNNTLVYMHLWGNDDRALWGNYDFAKAIEAGMEKNVISYSGEWGFVETYSYWPVNHMVAPKENALKCEACHSREGRINHLSGLYIPGAGSDKLLDFIGYIVLLCTLGGVLIHGILQLIITRRIK